MATLRADMALLRDRSEAIARAKADLEQRYQQEAIVSAAASQAAAQRSRDLELEFEKRLEDQAATARAAFQKLKESRIALEDAALATVVVGGAFLASSDPPSSAPSAAGGSGESMVRKLELAQKALHAELVGTMCGAMLGNQVPSRHRYSASVSISC